MNGSFLTNTSQMNIIQRIVLSIVASLFNILLICGQSTTEKDTIKVNMLDFDKDFIEMNEFDTTETTLDVQKQQLNSKQNEGLLFDEENGASFWSTYVFDPMRVGLKYELAYKIIEPQRFMNNRISLKFEYSKFLFNLFTLHIDSKLSTFLADDHRTKNTAVWVDDKVYDSQLAFGGRTRDFYIQTSFNKTSIKTGFQTLAWGESDFATVTDEISPLDYREPLSLNIDDFRLNQFMITIDQYSSIGKWSIFFVPYARFNEHAKEGSGYYYDPYNGSVQYETDVQDGNLFEYGIRWKKTFGKSDISIIATSLINNEYTLQMVNPELILRSKQRYHIAGFTFNHAINNFLLKGEVALKTSKTFNDTSFQILKRNTFDASFGFDYSVNATLKLSVEAVNYHVINWDEQILGVPEDNYMLLFVMGKSLLKNNLSIYWVTMYNGPFTSFFNVCTTSYNLNDHFTLYLDVLIPSSKNVNSGFYLYRNQKQVGFKIQYQF